MAATGDRVPSVYIENGRIVNLDPNDPVAVSYEEQIGDEPTGVSHPWLLKIQADLQHSGTIVDGISRIGWMTGGRNARWQDETMGDRITSYNVCYTKLLREAASPAQKRHRPSS